MSLTGYTDAQARRADIAAQLVGFLSVFIAELESSEEKLATDVWIEVGKRLIAAYEDTFDAPQPEPEQLKVAL